MWSVVIINEIMTQIINESITLRKRAETPFSSEPAEFKYWLAKICSDYIDRCYLFVRIYIYIYNMHLYLHNKSPPVLL